MTAPKWLIIWLFCAYISESVVECVMAEWGEWGEWTECSRSCGLGVSNRVRQCRLPHSDKSQMKSTCLGLYKEFRTCNPDDCPPGSQEFRAVQCAKYDNKTVNGRIYTWEPYYRDRDQCILACKAKVYRFYAKLADQVVDGTRCDPDDPYRICVAGRCESIGCDGVLGSKKTFDKCGVCGGNNTSCHIISGIYTRRNLPYGYNKVTTIPAGACNINITEMRPSGNYLALKKTSGGYILNGNWALGYSNDYQGAGAVFKYHRPLPRDGHNPLEYIVAKGPTNESVDVMILKQQDNRGVIYSYTIPTDKYIKHTGKEKPYIRHAPPPVVPRFVSKEDYSSQVAALSSGVAPSQSAHSGAVLGQSAQGSGTSISQSLDPAKDGADVQNDEGQLAYSQRYQAYLANLRRRQQLNDRVNPAYPRGTAVAASATAANNGDYLARLRAHRQRQVERRLRGETRLRHGRQKAASGRGPAIVGQNATGAESVLRKPSPGPYDAAGRQTVTSRRPTRTRQRQRQSLDVAPKPGVNYGLPSNSRKLAPNARQPVGRPYVAQPLVPRRPILAAGHQQLLPAVRQPLPAGARLPRPSGISSQIGRASQLYRAAVPGQPPRAVYPPNTVYPQQLQQQQLLQPGQTLPQTLPRYLPPNVVSPYKPTYDQYRTSWLGQLQSQSLGGAVNDQIAVSLPSRGRRPELGVLDTSADYSWKITGFTECSRSCGEGEQQTVIVCVKVSNQAIVTDDNCDNALKPETQSIPCNTHTCPPAWEVGPWGPCSTSCDRGQQTRTVECKQRVSKAVQLSVSATRCQHLPKPSIVKACNENKLCVRWKVGEWSKCSSECGRGQRTREVVCVNADDKPIPENACITTKPRSVEICDMGSCAKTWFYSEWSTECSTDCGRGVYTRDVYCSAEDRCRAIDRPPSEKPCENDIPCGGKWFTGPWGKCTVTCGIGVMKRPVLCIKRLGKLMAIVDDENCLSEDKPDHTQPCQRPPCHPQWYTTDWTECSKSCGTGFRTREVKCLSADKHPTSLCDPTLKPETRQTCNMLRCPKSRPGNRRRGHPASTEDKSSNPGCKDKFNNCLLVVQARLCSYDYYKTNCCLSCTSHEDYQKDN